MKAREVFTLVMWAVIPAILAGAVGGVLFGWRNETGGIGSGVLGAAMGAGIGGAWDGYRRIKKRRTRNMA